MDEEDIMNSRIASARLSLVAGLIVLCFRLFAAGNPQNTGWVLLGPEGGSVETFTQNPSDFSLYLTSPTAPCPIVKSTDRGDTWTPISQTINQIRCLAIDPINPLNMAAGARSFIYWSVDGGCTWRFQYVSAITFDGILFDPVDSEFIHAFGILNNEGFLQATYLKSTDGGEHWSQYIPVSPQVHSSPQAFAVDPSNPEIVYMALYYRTDTAYLNKLYKTTNGGNDWEDISLESGAMIYDLLIDPSAANKVYASTGSHVYRSSDWGNTWIQNNGWANGERLAIDPVNPNILYAGSYRRCHKSTDGGINWTVYDSGLEGKFCTGLIVDGETSDIVYYSNNTGIYKSTDGGHQWFASNSGFSVVSITELEHAPASPGVLYAGTSENGLFKTTQAAARASSPSLHEWENLPGLIGTHVTAMHIPPTTPDVLLVTMEDG